MSGGRKVNWTDIEIDDGETSANNNEANKFRLNMEEDEIDLETQYGESNNNRTEDKKAKENKVEEDFPEEAEDKTKRSPREESPRETEVDDDRLTPKKAHKRIRSLLGRVRESEAALAERDRIIEELSKRNVGFRKESVEVKKEHWKNAVAQKEAELEKAVGDDDPKAIVRATKELADAQMRHAAFEAVEEEEFEEEIPRVRQLRKEVPEVPDAAREWIARNKWFTEDPKKHNIARMISAEIHSEGTFDADSDEYWDELDKRLETFNIKAVPPKGREKEPEPAPQQRRKGSPVSSRSDDDGGYSYESDRQFVRSGNRVTANPSKDDVDMAERLGVNLTDFMKEKHKYAQQGYKGYVTIDVPGQ